MTNLAGPHRQITVFFWLTSSGSYSFIAHTHPQSLLFQRLVPYSDTVNLVGGVFPSLSRPWFFFRNHIQVKGYQRAHDATFVTQYSFFSNLSHKTYIERRTKKRFLSFIEAARHHHAIFGPRRGANYIHTLPSYSAPCDKPYCADMEKTGALETRVLGAQVTNADFKCC